MLNLLSGGTVGGYSDPIWFTATGMIGLIALAGIVVRNSIILIDFIHVAEKRGEDVKKLLSKAVSSGPAPFCLLQWLPCWEPPPSPSIPFLRSGLGAHFGLVASTAFTLVVVPVTVFAAVWKTGRRTKQNGP